MRTFYNATLLLLLGVGLNLTALQATSFHTISIDGANDFAADEDVPGTSGSTWYFTWDANNFYFAVDASDIGSGDANKWVHLYIDTDPNATIADGTGSTVGVLYNTQQPSLAYSANYHFRWRADNSFTSLEAFSGTWGAGDNTGIQAFQSGNFVEFAIPKANIGGVDAIHVSGAMINETGGGEFTFFMAPSGNSEGYNANYTSWFGFRIGDEGVSPDAGANINANLPVEWLFFDAEQKEEGVKLDWSTASEVNNSHFEIERSVDFYAWESLGEVRGQVESMTQQDYTFVDRAPFVGFNYYRLKQVDLDGKSSYSEVQAVDFKEEQIGVVSIFPNPTRDIVQINWARSNPEDQWVELYDLRGKLLRRESDHLEQLDLSSFQAGTYLLVIRSLNGSRQAPIWLIKQ